METAVTSQRDFEARTSERCPSCSAPMVGTNPSVLPLRCTCRQAAFISAMVEMCFKRSQCGLARCRLFGGAGCLAPLPSAPGWRLRFRQSPARQHSVEHRFQPRQILRRTLQRHRINFVVRAFDEDHLLDPVAPGRFLAIAHLQHLRGLVIDGALLALQGLEVLSTFPQAGCRLLDHAVQPQGFFIAFRRRHDHRNRDRVPQRAVLLSAEAQPPRRCRRRPRPASTTNLDT